MQIQQIRKRLPIIIAVACGILAIALMRVYLRQKEVEIAERLQRLQPPPQQPVAPVAPPQPKMGMVLVAKKEIPIQTPITASDIEIKEIPVAYIQPGAVTSLDKVIGQISTGPIAAGEQMLPIKLQPAGNIGKNLSELTPEGKRAVTIPVDNFSTIAGLLRPGNYVDVFALISPPANKNTGVSPVSGQLVPIGQHIQVLAVGSEVVFSPGKQPGSAGAGTVTLALTPQEGILYAFVQEHGKFRLILRSGEDAKLETIKPADWDTLLEYANPSFEKIEPSSAVEIYRGLEKELIPIYEKKK